MLRVDASFGDGWFYEGAGIYRHVWLTKMDALHLAQWESYIRTEVKGNSATLNLGTIVENQGTKAESCRYGGRLWMPPARLWPLRTQRRSKLLPTPRRPLQPPRS
jgi:hypothetical protein